MENAGGKMKKTKTRASSSEEARRYRQAGHDDAKAFAKVIGMKDDYQNDIQAKKDVIDPSGDAHSVKSGKKKWQIFLYGADRFIKDDGFTVMNGMGDLLVACINAFPKSFEVYLSNKEKYKKNLQPNMVAICNKLQDKRRLKAFFGKSMFNGTEVNYLTIKHDSKYHVLSRDDVLDIFANNLIVENSKARNRNQMDNQKVIFKYDNLNLAELEMRNDSVVHYREIRFNMYTQKAINLLLLSSNLKKEKFKDNVFVYGKAIKKFGRW
jgi:hypothetical protein